MLSTIPLPSRAACCIADQRRHFFVCTYPLLGRIQRPFEVFVRLWGPFSFSCLVISVIVLFSVSAFGKTSFGLFCLREGPGGGFPGYFHPSITTGSGRPSFINKFRGCRHPLVALCSCQDQGNLRHQRPAHAKPAALPRSSSDKRPAPYLAIHDYSNGRYTKGLGGHGVYYVARRSRLRSTGETPTSI